jgi:hypothetical protein
MANFATVIDLKQDALWRAGEINAPLPANGSAPNTDWDTRVLDYINATLQGLILGSPLGLTDERGMTLPGVDWWWARKLPHGTIYLTPEITTGTCSVARGSKLVRFSTVLTQSGAQYGSGTYGGSQYGGNVDLAGWRIRIGTNSTVPRFASSETAGGVTLGTLDEAWPHASVTAGTYTAFDLEYDLPSDFVRFTGPMILPIYPYRVGLIEDSAMDIAWPTHRVQSGTPENACLIANQKVRFSHYRSATDGPLRAEFPYVYLQELALTDTPTLPLHHRRILSCGAAYYILYDKADSKAGDMRSEFAALYRAMIQEHGRHMRKASDARFASIQYRLDYIDRRRPFVRTYAGDQ